MTPTLMLVQAIAHKDIRGIEQLYLKITNNENDVIINIGKKTFNSITNLTEKPPLIQKDKKGGKDEK